MLINKRHILVSLAAFVLAGLTVLSYFALVRADVLAASCAAGPIIGEIRIYAGDTPPDCWRFADGSQLQVNDYPQLYDVIQTDFGGSGGPGGDFYLPDLRGRMPMGSDDMGGISAGTITQHPNQLAGVGGAEMVTLTEAEMPQHHHGIDRTLIGASGSSAVGPAAPPNGTINTVTRDTGGNAAHNNMPPYLTLHYIIFVGK